MSFYRRDGDDFIASEFTRGPWSEKHQHGGPPSALIAHALPGDGFLARLTIDILRPIPLGRVRVETEAQKSGSKVQRYTARLFVDGTECMRAAAVRIRRNTVALPPRSLALQAALSLPPEKSPVLVLPFFAWHPSYEDAVEVRTAKGAWGQTPFEAWMRPRIALVEGEPLAPIEALLICVDAESGIGPPVDPHLYTYLNPDLSVSFEREPAGEWIGLSIRSTAEDFGAGLAQSEVHDASGVVARAMQTLVIEKRSR